MKTNVKNHMSRPYGFRTRTGTTVARVVVGPGQSVAIDSDAWEAAVKANAALQALLDQRRLTTSETSAAPVEVTTDQSGDAQKPEELAETKETDAGTGGKVQHTAKTSKVEVQISNAPKGGKKVE